MYSEDELIPISALQHYAFCKRQWGLMYLENIWSENVLTVEGAQLHEKSDQPVTEVRDNIRICRGLRVRSLEYGITGITDVVEFHEMPGGETKRAAAKAAIILKGKNGLWKPIPIEYKHGKPKADYCDEVQLCGQVLCLEEMLRIHIPKGFIYYGKQHKRYDVLFDNSLRDNTTKLIQSVRDGYKSNITPPPIYGKHCRSCSIVSYCMPKVLIHGKSARDYLEEIINKNFTG